MNYIHANPTRDVLHEWTPRNEITGKAADKWEPEVGHAVFTRWNNLYNTNDSKKGMCLDGFHKPKYNRYKRPLLKRKEPLSIDEQGDGICAINSQSLKYIANNIYETEEEFTRFLMDPKLRSHHINKMANDHKNNLLSGK